MDFNPNATGSNNMGLFSLPFNEEDSQLIFLPVPWEVTTSYGEGCSLGPQAIFKASKQLDLADALYGDFYKQGLFQRATDEKTLQLSTQLKKQALLLRDQLENGLPLSDKHLEIQKKINQESQNLNEQVYTSAKDLLNQQKFCAVIGGDHSSPFGLIKALSEKYQNLSVLHIDAHMDLRKAYQGYDYSHASIMYNVISQLHPHSLVQLGIRDFCPEERELAGAHKNIHTFYDSQVSMKMAQGTAWQNLVEEALSKLSDQVYISFDIDGLSPDLCPNTGTPVPGGLNFAQAETLLYMLSKSNKQIVGFDLCEVSPGPKGQALDCWDANVGARILFKLSGALLTSNKSHQ